MLNVIYLNIIHCSRMIVDSQLVWARDSTEGYIQGHISEIGPAEFEVIPIDRKYPKRICSVDDIFPSCDGPQDHDDNCKHFRENRFVFCTVFVF